MLPTPFPETIVITGGTGSFGSAFARFLLARTPARIRILSRDEHKQSALQRELPSSSRLTYILADVREPGRLRQAFDGASSIVHAAALKTVPQGERHADEFARTNIDGSRNVIAAALEARVPNAILISSDKACQPINTYGATKRVAESLFVQANAMGVTRDCRFSVVRGGNVWASNGSVATVWRDMLAAGQQPVVAGAGATRFHLEMPDWTAFVWRALRSMRGGEIFVPVPPAWRLGDLAEAAAPGRWLEIGRRDGDKEHETLVGADEAPRTVTTDWSLVIEPPEALRQVWNYGSWDGAPIRTAFSSDRARRMSMEELRALWAM